MPLLILLLVAAGIGAVVVTHSGREHHDGAVLVVVRAAGERDVSGRGWIESEAAVAVDPHDPRILLAGSNVIRPGAPMGVYQSLDGGRRWETGLLPMPPNTCATSDPTAAIDFRGHQYYAFLGLRCRHRAGQRAQVYLAARSSGHAGWRLLAAPATVGSRNSLIDDRPFLTVDNGVSSPHRGRLYLGWTRFSLDLNVFYTYPDQVGDFEPVQTAALVSHSDDGGAHWSRPRELSGQAAPLEVRLATAADGTLYAVWREQKSGSIWVARSSDGTAFDKRVFVAGAVVAPSANCGDSRARIPAQPRRCVSSNPVISVDRARGPRAGRVYVTWGTTSLNRSQDVYVASFEPNLKPLLGVGRVQQVNPPEGMRGPDEFLPASAVDPASGALWACYYQSVGRDRRSARFACTSSMDGGAHWSSPKFAASRPSNETLRQANRGNGYGDYEGVASAGGAAYTVWTDGRSLATHHEDIYGARLQVRHTLRASRP